MSYVVIGNFIALIGSVLLICTGLLSRKKHILFVQSIQICCFVVSNIVLKGYTGAVVNGLSFLGIFLLIKKNSLYLLKYVL